jgi:hypothetical protein
MKQPPPFVKLLILLCLLIISYGLHAQEAISTEKFAVPKGRFFGALTFSLNHRQAENEDQLIRYVLNQDKLNYTVRGGAGYAIKNNLTLGLGFGYGQQKEEITFQNTDGENITSKRLERGIAVVPNLRSFIPLGNGRIQIIVQTELGLKFGESLQRNFYTDKVDKITGNFFEANLGISPGALVFFDSHWAFETTVSLAGFATRFEQQTTNNDQDNTTRIVQSDIDLRLNLLQLNLGIAYYF